MSKKTKLFMYSGHSETVGGDARYFLDIIAKIDREKFDVHAYTDKNQVFEKRVKQWVSHNFDKIEYLDTKPVLFQEDKYRTVANFVVGIVTFEIKNSITEILKRLVTKFLKMITFKEIFDEVHNYKVFKRKFQEVGNIDVFHFNNGGYPGKRAGTIAMYLAKRMGVKKTVMTIQNDPAKWKWYRLSGYITDYVMNNYCDVIICPSHTLKENLSNYRGIPKEKMVVIYHGVDEIEPFKEGEMDEYRKSINIPENELVLLIVGHLGEVRKGHVELFKALNMIKDKMPAYKLIVIGDGERLSFLQQTTKDLGIDNNVMFLGYRTDLRELNLLTDILLQPSTGFEGVPYSIRDGMRACKPIVASSIGGIKEAVENDKNGFLLTGGDLDQLSSAILTLATDLQMRKRMGEKSHEMFMERFLLKRMVEKHQDFYNEGFTQDN